MRKLAVLIGLLLVIGLATPAMAGIGTALNGSLDIQLRYDIQPADGLSATGQLVLGNTITAGSEGNPKVVLTLGAWSTDTGVQPLTGLLPVNIGPLNLNVTGAYIQTVGPYWNGGSSVTTTLGTISVTHSAYIASGLGPTGVSLAGLKFGPFDVGTTYVLGYDVLAANVATKVADVNLGLTVLREPGDGESAAPSLDFAVNSSLQPAPGLTLGADYAVDGSSTGSVYKLSGKLAAGDNATLSLGYRGVNGRDYDGIALFNPTWASKSADNVTAVNPNGIVAHDLRQGFNLGLDTQAGGVTLHADYDDPTAAANVDLSTTVENTGLALNVDIANGSITTTTFTATRGINLLGANVAAKYVLTSTGGASTHDLSGTTTVNLLPQLQGVTLTGGVIVSSPAKYYLGASYTAPN
ncbi:MAG: hypothetical protein HYY08_04500, partial [Firmicutes bacterium]|nr:hypothetical protein [Bacillota bacterium]